MAPGLIVQAPFLYMRYVLLSDTGHPSPALARLDHVICRVPDIDRYHRLYTQDLGFPEAWPIGRFWPEGRTSGIALGGINLELIQLDDETLEEPLCDRLVFEPTSISRAESEFAKAGYHVRRFEKWEEDAHLLQLRGFHVEPGDGAQLICVNLFPDESFPVPMFLCDYTPELKARLSIDRRGVAKYGRVTEVVVRAETPGLLTPLNRLGYVGDIAISVDEQAHGAFAITAIHLENGALPSTELPLGFRLI